MNSNIFCQHSLSRHSKFDPFAYPIILQYSFSSYVQTFHIKPLTIQISYYFLKIYDQVSSTLLVLTQKMSNTYLRSLPFHTFHTLIQSKVINLVYFVFHVYSNKNFKVYTSVVMIPSLQIYFDFFLLFSLQPPSSLRKIH